MLDKLIDGGYSIAQFDNYLIVAINNHRHKYLPVEPIKQLLPDYDCVAWFGKVKIIL